MKPISAKHSTTRTNHTKASIILRCCMSTGELFIVTCKIWQPLL